MTLLIISSDGYSEKVTQYPTVPRIGETIVAKNNIHYIVADVVYNLYRNEIVVNVTSGKGVPMPNA